MYLAIGSLRRYDPNGTLLWNTGNDSLDHAVEINGAVFVSGGLFQSGGRIAPRAVNVGPPCTGRPGDFLRWCPQ